MKLRTASLAFALGLSVFALAPAASADVAPPESCGGKTAGEACKNAGGASFGNAGVCVDGMCPHVTPDGDGGLVHDDYPCTLCSKTAGSGTGGTGGTATTTATGAGGTVTATGAGGTAVTTTATTPAKGDDSSGGCGVGRTGSAGAGLAGLLLAAGAIAIARSRKR